LYQINQTVLKKVLFLLLPLVMFSCKDYDTQFDELTNMVASLEADNRALESQIAAVQAQDALIAQGTSARLTEFATAVSAALAQIGAGVTGSVQMLQGIMASLSQLATAIAANALTTDEINAQLDTLEELLKKVEADLEAHHTSGGSHTSGGN
jgi:multidrug resistance efflux pump